MHKIILLLFLIHKILSASLTLIESSSSIDSDRNQLTESEYETPLTASVSQTSTQKYKTMVLLNSEEGFKIPTVDANLKLNHTTMLSPIPDVFLTTATTPVEQSKPAVNSHQTTIFSFRNERETPVSERQINEQSETMNYKTNQSIETSTIDTNDIISSSTTTILRIVSKNETAQSNDDTTAQKSIVYLPVIDDEREQQVQSQNMSVLKSNNDYDYIRKIALPTDSTMKLEESDKIQQYQHHHDVPQSNLTQGLAIMFLILAGLLTSICVLVCIITPILWRRHPVKRRSRIHEMEAHLEKPIIINNLIPITKSNIREHVVPPPTKEIY
ncbi:unnamed protein product [Didymodactylos carnosus]|uniref:Uncharacterized protein n=1 Tax=Didymodactylos carnosus TaxID=1234261 RepID=A0A814K7B6_9BILA|nr:unnamed protein product [Didymodactylos carnosus]CAF3817368.1 unnamed protein product [Didymodactylos carnosus]